MDKPTADRVICEYTKKIYGFAISKTGSIERAEELAARITLEVYSSLLRQDRIDDIGAYIWRIAMNVRARFVDEEKKIPFALDEIDPFDPDDFTERVEKSETAAKLRLEIAYLSKLRRKILILHYYKNMKLADIAKELSLPLGTVKWHLSSARDELREGLTKMRSTGNLGISPISFSSLSHDGKPGTNGATEYYLKSRLSQNIVWAAYHKPRSLNEIADELGINPVWLEEDVETLYENGFLDRIGEKYQSNILIDDPTPENDIAVHELKQKYAKEIAKTFGPKVIEASRSFDRNDIYIPGGEDYLLDWLFAAVSAYETLNVSYDNSAYDKYMIARKDGGCYIAFATVNREYDLPFAMNRYSACGPMMRDTNKYPVYSWQLLTYYHNSEYNYADNKWEDYEYLYEFYTGRIKKVPEDIEKYMRLRKKGYLTEDDEVNVICTDHHGKDSHDTSFWKAIPHPDENETGLIRELSDKLLKIRLPRYPEHMRDLAKLYIRGANVRGYYISELVENGTLRLPTEKRAPGLCTIMYADRLPGR